MPGARLRTVGAVLWFFRGATERVATLRCRRSALLVSRVFDRVRLAAARNLELPRVPREIRRFSWPRSSRCETQTRMVEVFAPRDYCLQAAPMAGGAHAFVPALRGGTGVG